MPTYEDHRAYTDRALQPILDRIRRQALNGGHGVVEKVNLRAIRYRKPGQKAFLEVRANRHDVVLHIIDVPDPNRVLSAIPVSNEWKQLTGRAWVRTAQELSRVLPLVEVARLRG